MKRIVLSIALIVGLTTYGNAFTRAIEEPVTHVSDVANSEVSVASAPWTQLITSNLIKRDGVLINNPSTNSGNLFIHLSTVTTAPTISTNTAIIEIKPSDSTATLSVSEDIHIFGITTHTAAETIYLQEFRQTK